MKKLIAILLTALLMCSIVSCGEEEARETEKSNAAETVSSVETEAVETTATPEETESADAETASPETEVKAAETEAAATVESYVCVFDNGTEIEIGAVADSIVAALGTPLNIAEAPSCVHEGTDRIYSYNGFSLTTSPDGRGNDRVHEVALTSDALMLEGGISIGSSLDTVKAAFGSEYTEQFGVLQYIAGNAKISVVLDDDSCVSSLAITAAE